jgi:hypothetical protein
MVRTQIYLTKHEQKSIRGLSLETGKAQSQLIREAVDSFIERNTPPTRIVSLRKARGLWKNRRDVPDIRQLRREFERTK